MSFASLAQPTIEPLVERFASAPQVTLVVGAGASMEADLPSWPMLIERLLERVAHENPQLDQPGDRKDWIKRTLERDELLGAGAVVEVMADEDLDTLLPQALYGDAGPSGYEPGPIAHQVAQLRTRSSDRITILTTNYDDLIERALLGAGANKRQIKPYVRRRTEPPAGAIPVTHLHGYAGREGTPKKLVLTEEHYHRMQRGRSWQEEYVTERLENSLCLFIGTSLTDPNLIRYLYGYRASARRHAAVFVRQGDLEQATPAVRSAREHAISKRWHRCGVEPAFVDHYADAAQLLYEIGHRRASGKSCFHAGCDPTSTASSRPHSAASRRPPTNGSHSLSGCSALTAPASRAGPTATVHIRTRPPSRRSRSPLGANGSPSERSVRECVSSSTGRVPSHAGTSSADCRSSSSDPPECRSDASRSRPPSQLRKPCSTDWMRAGRPNCTAASRLPSSPQSSSSQESEHPNAALRFEHGS